MYRGNCAVCDGYFLPSEEIFIDNNNKTFCAVCYKEIYGEE